MRRSDGSGCKTAAIKVNLSVTASHATWTKVESKLGNRENGAGPRIRRISSNLQLGRVIRREIFNLRDLSEVDFSCTTKKWAPEVFQFSPRHLWSPYTSSQVLRSIIEIGHKPTLETFSLASRFPFRSSGNEKCKELLRAKTFLHERDRERANFWGRPSTWGRRFGNLSVLHAVIL